MAWKHGGGWCASTSRQSRRDSASCSQLCSSQGGVGAQDSRVRGRVTGPCDRRYDVCSAEREGSACSASVPTAESTGLCRRLRRIAECDPGLPVARSSLCGGRHRAPRPDECRRNDALGRTAAWTTRGSTTTTTKTTTKTTTTAWRRSVDRTTTRTSRRLLRLW